MSRDLFGGRMNNLFNRTSLNCEELLKEDERPLVLVHLTDFGNLQMLVSTVDNDTREIKIYKDPSVDTLAKIVTESRFEYGLLPSLPIVEAHAKSKENMKTAFRTAFIREIRDTLQKDIDAGKMVRIRDGQKLFSAIRERCDKEKAVSEFCPNEYILIMNDVFKNLKADQCFMKKEKED